MLNYNKSFERYISHRINEIRRNSGIKQRNYIPKSFNVVDDATKCIDVAKLQNDHRWFVGLDFLYNEGFPIDIESTKYEIKAENKTILHNTGHISERTNIVKQSNNFCNSIIYKYKQF